jgi:D-serine deaminase-like pyridoxal phosphate-dependent protein
VYPFENREDLSRRYAHYRAALHGKPLPLAWLDRNALKHNALELLERAGDLPIRLATKSIRCRQVLREVQQLDARFQGLMCYHADEAAWLSEQGFDDLLVAYPTMQTGSLEAVARRVKQGARIALMTDSAEHLQAAARAASALGTRLPVWLDVDCSVAFPGLWFGVRRSPLRDLQALDPYLDALEKLPALKLEGLMGYEAQIAGVADAAAGKAALNAVIRALKHRSGPAVARRRQAFLHRLEERGHRDLRVNGGGTGSLESTRKEPWITELAAGSGLFGPWLFDGYRQFRPRPAAGFALEVCRRPDPQYATCLGGGYIASGSAGPEKQPQPYLPPGLALDNQEMAGEVQTPLRGAVDGLSIGDPVFFRHAKAGELCEHFMGLWALDGASEPEFWATYRGQGHCFLG